MRRSDRRGGRRVPCRLVVWFRSAEDLREHYITNLSEGGVFVESVYPLPIGTQARLEILVGQGNARIVVMGEVMWVKNPADGPGPGMGIRFLDPSSAVRKALLDLVAEHTPS